MREWDEAIRRRIGGMSLEPAREAAAVEEIAQHMEDRFEELRGSGVSDEDARRAVLSELDGDALTSGLRATLPRAREAARIGAGADSSEGLLSGIAADLRQGLRLLRWDPAFAAVAIVSLALGIGANTAIFQLLDAVRLRALPVPHPEELYNVKIARNPWGRSGNFSGYWPQLTNAIWERLRGEQQAFTKIAVFSGEQLNLAPAGEARYVEGLWVSGGFFDLAGVPPLRGRLLTAADDTPGCGSPSIVVSERFWRGRLGAREDAVGERLSIEGHPFEIAGVSPARFFGFEVGRDFDVALPVCAEALIGEHPRVNRLDGWFLAAVGRLKPDWTVDRANEHLKAISPGLFEPTVPARYDAVRARHYRAFKLEAQPLSSGLSDLRESYANPLWLLLGISATVLLIACANLANLLFARATARQREIAVRLALGASRRRLVRQLLAESLVLAAVGAAAGVALAQALSRLLVGYLSTRDTHWFVAMRPDARILGFAVLVGALTCVLFGLLPALQASRTQPIEALKAGGRGTAGGGTRMIVRRALVVAQVSLSLVLLVGALLFVATFRNLLSLDAGFRRDHLQVVQLNLSRLKPSEDQRPPLRRRILERLRAVPGVEAAAGLRIVPASGNGWNEDVKIEGTEAAAQTANFNRVSPGYFATMGTPLVAGRDFDDHDVANSEPVAIVTETFVRKFFGGANPIGHAFTRQEDPGSRYPRHRIVGVVKDSKYGELREDFTPIVFVADLQDDDRPSLIADFVVRSPLPLGALAASIKSAVAETSPDIGLDFQPFRDLLGDGLVRERLLATLAGFFGLLAAVLAMVGLYGVISYMVVRRRNEIGVRMAIGATRRDIVAMVLREAAALLGLGVAIGAVLAVALGGLASTMLFGLKPTDPGALAMAVVAMAAVAGAASFLPARRAATLNPVAALREE
jgi:putative ABC transport system permease protein